jgi:hypothetical protein
MAQARELTKVTAIAAHRAPRILMWPRTVRSVNAINTYAKLAEFEIEGWFTT